MRKRWSLEIAGSKPQTSNEYRQNSFYLQTKLLCKWQITVVLSSNFVQANILLLLLLVSQCVPLSIRPEFGREISKGEDRPICSSYVLKTGLPTLAPPVALSQRLRTRSWWALCCFGQCQRYYFSVEGKNTGSVAFIKTSLVGRLNCLETRRLLITKISR